MPFALFCHKPRILSAPLRSGADNKAYDITRKRSRHTYPSPNPRPPPSRGSLAQKLQLGAAGYTLTPAPAGNFAARPPGKSACHVPCKRQQGSRQAEGGPVHPPLSSAISIDNDYNTHYVKINKGVGG